MSSPPQTEKHPTDVLSVAVIGNDTVLAALPAHPVQLAHGCHLLGYHTVVPASWGDELIADAILREAEQRGRRPAIVCACDRARARLTTGAGVLEPFLISTISPPVATARHLRALLVGRRLDITFVGDCASGADPAFDARYSPDVFLVRLQSAGINLLELPTHFDNLMPPDRRRHASLPGGCPTADALARRCPHRQLMELTDTDIAVELAQQLFTQDAVLLDVSLGVGCACAGVRQSGSARTARVAVMSLEPPRSGEPIIDGASLVDVSISSPSPVKVALLARDPDADVVQATLPEPEPDVVSSPHFVGEEDIAPALLSASIAVMTDSDWEPVTSAPRSRPLFAITPPRAIRAIQTARAASQPVVYSPPQLSREPSGVAADRAEPRELSRLQQNRPGPIERQGREATPIHELPVLTEDPVATTHRAAQARIKMHVRQVPPPPAQGDLLRQVLLWGAVILGVVLFVVEIISRSL